MAISEGSEDTPLGQPDSARVATPGSTDSMQGTDIRSSSVMTNDFARIKGFEIPMAGVSHLNPDRKAPNGSSVLPANPTADHGVNAENGIPQPKLPPACIAGLRVLDLSTGSPRGSGSPSSEKLTPVSDSGGTGSAMSPSKLLRKFELYSGNPRASSVPASPSHGPRTASRAKLSQDDFHSR